MNPEFSRNFEANTLADLTDEALGELLSLELGSKAETFIRDTLFTPVLDLLARPKKNLRAKLTELGVLASDGISSGDVALAYEVIEAVHGGSLIVDDIEDGSHFRRGKPTLHEHYGVPVALNAGNWLYFWPLELIRRMGLNPQDELSLYRLYHRTLLRAHFGQALDVGVSVKSLPEEKLYPVCLAALELKSGTLSAFAIGMGAIVGGASAERLADLLKFGHRFGVALQMLDDIGNFLGQKDPQKKWEDLMLSRPTWIWACLGQEHDSKRLESFKLAVGMLPQEELLKAWMKENSDWVCEAQKSARNFLRESVAGVRKTIGNSKATAILNEIESELLGAYA